MRHRTIEREGETILRIAGALDAHTVGELDPTVDALVASRRRITIDLSSLDLLDSAGVGLLVRLRKRFAERGGAARVIGLREQPLAMLRLLRLDHYLTAPVGDGAARA